MSLHEQFSKATVAIWSFSLPLGRFEISVPLPLDREDAELILGIMELVKRQITRWSIEPAPAIEAQAKGKPEGEK